MAKPRSHISRLWDQNMQISSRICIYDNSTMSWFRIDTSACFHAKSNEMKLSEINIRSRNRFVRDPARRFLPLCIQAHRSLPAAAHHVWDFFYYYVIYISNYRVIIRAIFIPVPIRTLYIQEILPGKLSELWVRSMYSIYSIALQTDKQTKKLGPSSDSLVHRL